MKIAIARKRILAGEALPGQCFAVSTTPYKLHDRLARH